MSKNAKTKKGPAQLRPGKAGVSGLVRKGGGAVRTLAAGAEDAGKVRTESSHLATKDAAARKALVAIGAVLKGLQSLDSNEQTLVNAALREIDRL